ncbi:hypothetical protein J437_LFUL009897 [Ladona fulva]|uniref:Uncharacterized protein n=1 Tax=Ladona fulva TaxID=123851 RepID=A0A8K0K4T8_LADFU|nr:hypothetical protein J437_LFUL009897 [Ladona fulva]
MVEASAEYDFLRAIKIPFEDSKTQFFEDGLDGFPAFGLRAGSDIKSPYRLFLPESLPADFSISATIRPHNLRGGYLFAVVNPMETLVQLGVQISPNYDPEEPGDGIIADSPMDDVSPTEINKEEDEDEDYDTTSPASTVDGSGALPPPSFFGGGGSSYSSGESAPAHPLPPVSGHLENVF